MKLIRCKLSAIRTANSSYEPLVSDPLEITTICQFQDGSRHINSQGRIPWEFLCRMITSPTQKIRMESIGLWINTINTCITSTLNILFVLFKIFAFPKCVENQITLKYYQYIHQMDFGYIHMYIFQTTRMNTT